MRALGFAHSGISKETGIVFTVRRLAADYRAPARLDDLQSVTAAALGHRRKMLRQSLRTLGADPRPLLAAAGIAETARAEDIPVEGFVALARAFAASQ